MEGESCFQTLFLSKTGRITRNNDEVKELIDLANWMKNLNDEKRNSSITSLAIPGSHDSMTYGISRTSKIAPDAEPVVKELAKYLKPFVNLVMYSWSVTQNTNVKEQLNLGIRYLDLRIATKDNDSQFYFVHGMYGHNVTSGLSDIKDYLNQHLKETVILDFQHFYDFNNLDHERLINLVISIFGEKLCPRPIDLSFVTLETMFENGYQVIVIYRNSNARHKTFLWTSNMWPNPWPNTMNVTDLQKYLDDHLAKRPNNAGFVSQCVLTPQTSTVVFHPFSGVMSKCAVPVSKTIIPWIKKQSPPLNVAIADFIDMNNANFPLSVISLNYS
ncbi:hypothetical protein O3M35_008213 [Rhynocoris fuscipes]|uniref:Phosphatidylinositol-specific phospholipase C X domain-containing protein n=1 Tax=Rhynocoris fuscipes TaxID=488301 RepID=A0AAW1D857_9HEMI